MKKNIEPLEEDNRLEEFPATKNKTWSIFVGKAQWEKLEIIRGELGTWRNFIDVAIEQLLASGLISEEARQKIHKINQAHDIDYLDDTSWRDAFRIREPWPEAARHLRVINETLKEINDGLGNLAQTVDDHATAMLEAELVKPDDSAAAP
jgi:hypothetical protein